jgi:hypothetical protein
MELFDFPLSDQEQHCPEEQTEGQNSVTFTAACHEQRYCRDCCSETDTQAA